MLWEEVGERTGSEWAVKARMDGGMGGNVGERRGRRMMVIRGDCRLKLRGYDEGIWWVVGDL